MPKKLSTKVRFLGGHAPRPDFLGVLAFPAALEAEATEHTRFYMAKPERWVHRPLDADIVSVEYVDGPEGKSWRLLGKRGAVYSISAAGLSQEQIADAGTGKDKLGYLTALRLTDGALFACGVRRQVYERTADGWVHRDQGLLLGKNGVSSSLNDLVGGAGGVLCAVGTHGEVAVRQGGTWAMANSGTTEHLYAVCIDDQARFCAAGANGTVIRSRGSAFEVLCSKALKDPLWDIAFFRGELVVSATAGLLVVRDGALLPFDKPDAPTHVGHKLEVVDDTLFSIGTHQIFALKAQQWTEWVCPDNA